MTDFPLSLFLIFQFCSFYYSVCVSVCVCLCLSVSVCVCGGELVWLFVLVMIVRYVISRYKMVDHINFMCLCTDLSCRLMFVPYPYHMQTHTHTHSQRHTHTQTNTHTYRVRQTYRQTNIEIHKHKQRQRHTHSYIHRCRFLPPLTTESQNTDP